MKIEIAPIVIICATGGALVVAAHHPHYECRSTELCENHKSMHMSDTHEREPAPMRTSNTLTVAVASTSATAMYPSSLDGFTIRGPGST
jgi:hypothetical protein